MSIRIIQAAILGSSAVVEEELQKGESPNQQSLVTGYTVLIAAIRGGKPSIVRRLLDVGADPTVPDFQGKDPLAYAIESKNEDIIDMIFEANRW
jgi:ankyrin repeat protein